MYRDPGARGAMAQFPRVGDGDDRNEGRTTNVPRAAGPPRWAAAQR